MSALRCSRTLSTLVLIAIVLVGSPLGAKEPPITSLAFSPDNASLVTASQAGIRVLAWPTLTLHRPLDVQVSDPRTLAFSPDGTRLAIGGGAPAEEGVCQILDWPSGESTCVINEHTDAITCVAWLDERRFACGSLDHDITIAQVDSGEILHRLKGHSRGVTSLASIGGTETMVSSGVDQSLRVWNVVNGELIRSLNQHTQTVHGLATRPRSTGLPIVASASDDKTIRLWQPTIGRMMRFVRLSSRPLSIAWSDDGSRLFAACTDGSVQSIDPDLVRVDGAQSVTNGWAYAMAVHPTSGKLAVGGEDGDVKAASSKEPFLRQD